LLINTSQRYAKSLEKDSRFAKIDSHFAKRESIFGDLGKIGSLAEVLGVSF